MSRTLSRALAATVAAVALTAVGAGVANAATPSSGAPIWVLPGLDAGSLLGPTVPVPAEALAPVDGLLQFISG